MSAFNVDLKDPAIWLLAPLVAPLLPFALLSGCDEGGKTTDVVDTDTDTEYSTFTNVQTISAGSEHTCAVLTSGNVKCWGHNTSGKLGNGISGQEEYETTPVDVADLSSEVQTISVGLGHTCAVLTSGGAKCWGANWYGQLGDGTSDDSSTPVDVAGLSSDVQAIAAGGYHTCALLTSGGVKCWGENNFGQLGKEASDYETTPVDVIGLSSGVQAITAEGFNTCALLVSGGVKCWGANVSGQLGNGQPSVSSTAPVNVSGLFSNVQVISSGGSHTCALLTSGGVMCWGNNEDGQLGNGIVGIDEHETTPVDVVGLSSGVQAISAGGNHTCAILTSGGVKCWGSAGIGNGTDEPSPTPVDVVGLSSGAQAITAGGGHICAVLTSGGMKCWGYNEFGQLGNGTTDDSSIPVDVVCGE